MQRSFDADESRLEQRLGRAVVPDPFQGVGDHRRLEIEEGGAHHRRWHGAHRRRARGEVATWTGHARRLVGRCRLRGEVDDPVEWLDGAVGASDDVQRRHLERWSGFGVGHAATFPSLPDRRQRARWVLRAARRAPIPNRPGPTERRWAFSGAPEKLPALPIGARRRYDSWGANTFSRLSRRRRSRPPDDGGLERPTRGCDPGLSPGWSKKHLGMDSRRLLGPHESAVDLAIAALQNALDDEGWAGRDLDLIVSGSSFPDNINPASAAFLAEASNPSAVAFDVGAVCATLDLRSGHHLGPVRHQRATQAGRGLRRRPPLCLGRLLGPAVVGLLGRRGRGVAPRPRARVVWAPSRCSA